MGSVCWHSDLLQLVAVHRCAPQPGRKLIGLLRPLPRLRMIHIRVHPLLAPPTPQRPTQPHHPHLQSLHCTARPRPSTSSLTLAAEMSLRLCAMPLTQSMPCSAGSSTYPAHSLST